MTGILLSNAIRYIHSCQVCIIKRLVEVTLTFCLMLRRKHQGFFILQLSFDEPENLVAFCIWTVNLCNVWLLLRPLHHDMQDDYLIMYPKHDPTQSFLFVTFQKEVMRLINEQWNPCNWCNSSHLSHARKNKRIKWTRLRHHIMRLGRILVILFSTFLVRMHDEIFARSQFFNFSRVRADPCEIISNLIFFVTWLLHLTIAR